MTLGSWNEVGAVRNQVGDFDFFSSLKALCYFGDGDLPGLSEDVKNLLRRAAAAVRKIPEVPRRSDRIEPEP